MAIKISKRFSRHIKKNAWKPSSESMSIGPKEPRTSDSRQQGFKLRNRTGKRVQSFMVVMRNTMIDMISYLLAA